MPHLRFAESATGRAHLRCSRPPSKKAALRRPPLGGRGGRRGGMNKFPGKNERAEALSFFRVYLKKEEATARADFLCRNGEKDAVMESQGIFQIHPRVYLKKEEATARASFLRRNGGKAAVMESQGIFQIHPRNARLQTVRARYTSAPIRRKQPRARPGRASALRRRR